MDLTSKGLNRPTKPQKTMDRQKELQHIKEEYQNLFEAVQNLSRYIEKMESVISTPEPKEPETWEDIPSGG